MERQQKVDVDTRLKSAAILPPPPEPDPPAKKKAERLKKFWEIVTYVSIIVGAVASILAIITFLL